MRKTGRVLLLVVVTIIAAACMEHAHCDDKLIKLVSSPDKALQVAIYNRSCSRDTSRFTYAIILKASSWFKEDFLCSIATLHNYHPMEAVWQDNKHLKISSTDQLIEGEISSKQETCSDIQISYDFKINPPTSQEAPSPRILLLIRKALEESDQCLREKSGEPLRNSLHAMLEAGRHREVLQLLCHNLNLNDCAISRETYDNLKEAGVAMEINSKYWDDLKSQIR